MSISQRVHSEMWKHSRVLESALVIALCGFVLFYRLDKLAIRQWDEARNAVAALEMAKNHNFLVRHFDGAPDYFDIKPPLLIWLQVICINIFGPGEFAIRLPSALAALLTIFFLIGHLGFRKKNFTAGYLASFILVTSQGYLDRHMARTGDHDALLVLVTTMIIVLYYEFLIDERLNNRLLFVIAVLFMAGIFTKSISVLMIVPGMLVMAFVHRAQRRLLLNPRFYFYAISILILTGSYYLFRESVQEGYLKAVWNGELIPRYINTYENFQREEPWFYVYNLFQSRFAYWIWFAIPAVFVHKWEIRGPAVYLLVQGIAFLCVISAGTSNIWYDGPIFPILAALVGLFLSAIWRQVGKWVSRFQKGYLWAV
jgi:4-amino-4-deoxy-L-arabinose transferase-like glycosyltransferase